MKKILTTIIVGFILCIQGRGYQEYVEQYHPELVQTYNHANVHNRISHTQVNAPLTNAELINFIKYARRSHIYHRNGGLGTPLFHDNWVRIYDETIRELQ